MVFFLKHYVPLPPFKSIVLMFIECLLYARLSARGLGSEGNRTHSLSSLEELTGQQGEKTGLPPWRKTQMRYGQKCKGPWGFEKEGSPALSRRPQEAGTYLNWAQMVGGVLTGRQQARRRILPEQRRRGQEWVWETASPPVWRQQEATVR